MLLGIILFSLSMGFSLICRMWAFSITHNRLLGRADWAFILGWRQRPDFNRRAFSLGLVSGPASPFRNKHIYYTKFYFSYNPSFTLSINFWIILFNLFFQKNHKLIINYQ